MALDGTRRALAAECRCAHAQRPETPNQVWLPGEEDSERKREGTVVCAVKSEHRKLMHKLDVVMLFSS